MAGISFYGEVLPDTVAAQHLNLVAMALPGHANIMLQSLSRLMRRLYWVTT